jgi:hypothetical protein
MDKPILSQSGARESRMVPYAVVDANGIELARDYLDSFEGVEQEQLVREIVEQYTENQHLVYGDDKGKLYGMLGQVDSVIVGKALTMDEYHAELRQHPPGHYRADSLEGQKVHVGEQLPAHVYDRPGEL